MCIRDRVKASNFIGNPKIAIDALNTTYDTNMFIVSPKHPGKVLIEKGGRNGETVAYPINTTKEVEVFLKAINDFNRVNTEYK